MRQLVPAPASVVDPRTGRPRIGSYRGGLPRVDWSQLPIGATRRRALHKRWLYVAIATGEVYVALAVARLLYASTAFIYAYDANERRMIVRRSWLTLPFAARVGDTGGEGCRAAFQTQGAAIVVERAPGQTLYRVHVDARRLSLEASLDAAAAPPAIGAVAEVAPGHFDATEKRALLAGRGSLRVGDRSVPLDGALAGYDFTSGLPPRHTRWRWAFALGRLAGGAPFALNLIEDFVGEAECAAWIGDELVGLGEGRFAFDRAKPDAPWSVRTADGIANLTMHPGAVHRERRELVLVGSRFVQPCGIYRGSLALPGRPVLTIDRALGVTEDQDVTW
jgi:hypothetical protein